MKKYNITVNGKAYEVEVEEVGGSAAPTQVKKAEPTPIAKPAAVKQAPKAAESKPEVPKAVEVSHGETAVEAPMPGTVLDVHVSAGDSVTAGQVLLILEAMKMENEIMAPKSGVVRAVLTSKGVSVNTGDVLVIIE
ncbi:MAG: glutaconyl-CoA/methylmalonyl-CoA decarboxylase subunit gamma [Clostridiales bacterium]|nr:glutaconyl-CoA/methylmalonyl-CoA decarboxylase subunit gamma [Clostridiales bacterium]